MTAPAAPCADCATPTPLADPTGRPRCLTCTWPTGSPATTVTPGRCDAGQTPCGQTARLYPAGWLCNDHAPTAIRTHWKDTP